MLTSSWLEVCWKFRRELYPCIDELRYIDLEEICDEGNSIKGEKIVYRSHQPLQLVVTE